MKIHRFTLDTGTGEQLERFLGLRERLYSEEYFYYPETDLHSFLLGYYGQRPDYAFELLLAEQADGVDVARVLVGRCENWPWAFFGFFECADDPVVFSTLMDAACGVARRLGADELRGPIELNAMHNWMFLTSDDGSGRWVGDPYHKPHHPHMFEAAGWEPADQSISGIYRPEANERLVSNLPEAGDRLDREGYRLVRLGDVPEETLFEGIWDVVRASFTPELHRFIPVEYGLFREYNRALVPRLKDPHSLLAYMKDDTMAGFALSYENFIEDLCNPDGSKQRPLSAQPSKCRFALKTIAVAPDFRGSTVYTGLLATVGEFTQRRYGHGLAWRRTNVANPGTRNLREAGDIIHTYSTFRRGLS